MEPWTSPSIIQAPQEPSSISPVGMELRPTKEALPIRIITLQTHPGAMISTLIWTMICRPTDTWSKFRTRRTRRSTWPNFSAPSLSQRLLSNRITRAVRIKLPGAVSELVGTIKIGTENAGVQISQSDRPLGRGGTPQVASQIANIEFKYVNLHHDWSTQNYVTRAFWWFVDSSLYDHAKMPPAIVVPIFVELLLFAEILERTVVNSEFFLSPPQWCLVLPQFGGIQTGGALPDPGQECAFETARKCRCLG